MLIYKAEILGLLCSDGNYREYTCNFLQFDRRRGKAYPARQHKRIMEFANIDFMLLRRFQNLLNKVYCYKPNITISNHNVFRVCITKNFVINDLLKYVTLGTSKWSVPGFVIQGSKNVKSSFIQGFFDGDGSVGVTNDGIPRIRLSSTNLKGVKQLQLVLGDLGIKSSLNGPYIRNGKRDSYELLLKTESVGRFINSINSNHSQKRRKLRIAEGICRGRL